MTGSRTFPPLGVDARTAAICGSLHTLKQLGTKSGQSPRLKVKTGEVQTEDPGSHSSVVRKTIETAERGAELTSRLLAFSRKQTLSLQSINLAALVSGMKELLERSLGETIEIETILPKDLWHVTADKGQLQDAILNLAINARDAMPEGGKLTIKCSNAQSDSGSPSAGYDVLTNGFVLLWPIQELA